MKINLGRHNIKIDTKKVEKQVKKAGGNLVKAVKNAPVKVKQATLIATFLLPTIGVVSNCASNEKEQNVIEIVDEPVDIDNREKFLNIEEPTFHIVKPRESIALIAKKHNISDRRVLHENGLSGDPIIHPKDTVLLPKSYVVKNVKDLNDVSKLTGLSSQYLEDLRNFETVLYKVKNDRNGNPTIGIGHLVKADEKSTYKNGISDEQIYTLLGQDLIDAELDLKTKIPDETFDKIPSHLREAVLDLAFNKGVGAVINNEKLSNALITGDYVTAIANLNQDYSVIKLDDGKTIKKPASGLSKRRLYDISHASKIFKNGVPDKVLASAKKVYDKGLQYIQDELDRGEIKEEAYPNILAEYKNLAYEWFDGRIGEKLESVSKTSDTKNEKQVDTPKNEVKTTSSNKPNISASKIPNGNKIVRVQGQKTEWRVDSLYNDWEKTRVRHKRAIKRPYPCVDANGNFVASVKTISPKKGTKGPLVGKTIIINPGHGGGMNNIEKSKKGKVLNVNFDPGASNAVMRKDNPNIETNVFIGNGGKSLEEWVVNQRIADKLVEKILAAGGTVVYVQGSVYSAQKAIREIQNKQKIDMIFSLHSNSDNNKRGVIVFSNKRSGITDKGDQKLSKFITDNLNEHSWFKGITSENTKSLGVLSKNAKETSAIPGVLIETGNLKNEKDVANLNSRDFQNHIVNSMYNGIIEYFGK